MQKLDELCAQWRDAKYSEDATREHRIQIENEILELTGNREEGSETTAGDHYKVTTTGKLTRSVDWEVFDSIQVPVLMQPVKTTRKLDLAGLRWLERNEFDLYQQILPAITTKPAKTAIKVEPLKED